MCIVPPKCLGVVAAFVLAASAAESRGQNFFGGGGNAFDPEISVVSSGAVLDAQATVSADRKYVTLTTRAQVAQLVALRDFVFQSGAGGVVGLGGNGNGGGNAGGANISNGVNPANAKPSGATAASSGGAVAARPAAAASPARAANGGPLLPALAKPAASAGPTPVLLQEGMHRVDAPAVRATTPK